MRVRRSEPGDAAFLLEMARLASGLEDRPLPSTDAPDVLAPPASTDVALIATDHSGNPLGAAWWHMHDPPLLNGADGSPLPELAMAVKVGARGQGVGTALVEALASEAAHRSRALTLNVHLANRAVRRLSSDVVGQPFQIPGLTRILGLTFSEDGSEMYAVTSGDVLYAARLAEPDDHPGGWSFDLTPFGVLGRSSRGARRERFFVLDGGSRAQRNRLGLKSAVFKFDVLNEPDPRATLLQSELLIDCEEDRTLRAVLVGMLREAGPLTRAPVRATLTRTCHASGHISGREQDVRADAGICRRNPDRVRALRSGRGVVGYCVYFFFFKKGDIDDFG